MIEHLHPTPQLPERVVILGSTGFAGRALAAHLAELRVPTLGFGSTELDLSRAESVDLLQQQLRPTDALVFISALTPDKGRDIRTLMKNLAMGEHVCAALSGTPPRCAQVVYLSSDAVYADGETLVREASVCSPSSFHGLMHLVRERMLTFTLEKTGVPLLMLRPSLLYGAGDTHNGYGPNRFARLARQHQAIQLFGGGEEKRDHLYVEDLCRLIALGLQQGSRGVLNVATGTSTPFAEVARQTLAMAGSDLPVECLPRSTPITHRHFDSTETHRAFPAFVYTSLPEGLARTFAELDRP